MLDHSNPVAALAIFAASIAGSVHCVGMCGGLMLAATGTNLRSQLVYHLFRWFGYLMVGGIAGYVGDELFYDWRWLPFQMIFSSIFLFLLILIGLNYFFGWFNANHVKLPLFSSISKFGIGLGFKMGKGKESFFRAGMVGFFTVFLPCGWLYSFVLLSLATHSPAMGALTLTVFWLGTLPALMSSRIIIQGMLSKIGVSGTRAISILMILAAFLSAYKHWVSVAVELENRSPSQSLNCH